MRISDWSSDVCSSDLAFMDAIKELAAEAGMDVPRADPREAARAERRASLHDVTTAAQEWFKENLWSAEGKSAREYLEKRGIGHDQIGRASCREGVCQYV